eukprot:c20241_g1_i1 orf=754-1248(-)
MASASLWGPSCNNPLPRASAPLQPEPAAPLRTVATTPRCVSTPTSSRDTKLSVLQNSQDGWVELSHGWLIPAIEVCSLDSHQSWTCGAASEQLPSALWKRSNVFDTLPYSKTSPFPFLAQVQGHLCWKSSKRQQMVRHQVWLGYWIGPEEVDGWGFVEAFLQPS